MMRPATRRTDNTSPHLRSMLRFIFHLAIVLAFLPISLCAEVRLSTIFSDGMVLQKSKTTPVWGWALPGQKISVQLADQTVATQADEQGHWRAFLNLESSGIGPFEMTVRAGNEAADIALLKVSDVLVGEVWLASGQSNMEWPLSLTINAAQEIKASANPHIRMFQVKRNAPSEPVEDIGGVWQQASPETSGTFTAVGYFFAKALEQELQVPIGIIRSSWPGSLAEPWISREAIASVPELAQAARRSRELHSRRQEQKIEFLGSISQWLNDHQRIDPGSPRPQDFAGIDVSTADWVELKIPGKIEHPELPRTGVIWLRREVFLNSKQPVAFTLPINGIEEVYWNSQRLTSTLAERFPGLGVLRRGRGLMVPADKTLAGKNILAIRFFQPIQTSEIRPGISGDPVSSLAGTWMAKAETTFPDLSTAEVEAAPRLFQAPAEPHRLVSHLFNGMIAPLVPYGIRGVIWYQGESNVNQAFNYRTIFPLLITDWRRHWGNDNLPFYFCQLANFQEKKSLPGESARAELREAQALALQMNHTGQAVLIDLGESQDIHARNKKDVGDRLARIALANDYKRAIPFSGPIFDSVRFSGGKAVVTFKEITGKLNAAPLPETYVVRVARNQTAPLKRNTPESDLEGFAICGEDRQWVWADAKIEGKTVVVRSEKIPRPVAVRYGWADNPTVNLTDESGLPASPFRTDDFPAITAAEK